MFRRALRAFSVLENAFYGLWILSTQENRLCIEEFSFEDSASEGFLDPRLL